MSKFVDLAIIVDEECTVGKFVAIQGRVSTESIVCAYEDHRNPQYSYLMLITGQAIHIDLNYDDLIKIIS